MEFDKKTKNEIEDLVQTVTKILPLIIERQKLLKFIDEQLDECNEHKIPITQSVNYLDSIHC